MPNNYFITGMPKTGKSTLMRELARKMKARGLRVGGLLSVSEKASGRKERYSVLDLDTGQSALIAAMDADGPKVSKYHVDVRAFEDIAIPAMTAPAKYDVFVLDEIGPMEMRSARFGDLLADLLGGDMPLIACINQRYVEDYRAWGTVLEVTPGNRERTLAFLLRRAGQMKVKTEAVGKFGERKKKAAARAAKAARAGRAPKEEAKKKEKAPPEPGKKRKKKERPLPLIREEKKAPETERPKQETTKATPEGEKKARKEEGGFFGWLKRVVGG